MQAPYAHADGIYGEGTETSVATRGVGEVTVTMGEAASPVSELEAEVMGWHFRTWDGLG